MINGNRVLNLCLLIRWQRRKVVSFKLEINNAVYDAL